MTKLGLALGGGGARGAAHLGVLEILHEHDLWPDLITGTSIGGLIGALIAASFKLAEIKSLFERFSLTQMFGLPFSGPALSSNTKIESFLEEVLGRISFADLDIPLAVVAVDLVSRKEVVLDEGDLITAVMATMAFPVLLPPIEREGLELIDGGLLNNVPFDVARARGATAVIAVDLSDTAPYGTPSDAPTGGGLVWRALAATQRRPLWQLLSTVMDIVSAQPMQARLAISPPDLLIRPEMGTIGLFDFNRYEEGITAGREAAQAVHTQLAKLAAKRGRVKKVEE